VLSRTVVIARVSRDIDRVLRSRLFRIEIFSSSSSVYTCSSVSERILVRVYIYETDPFCSRT
jgi:hypothetical protein